MSAESADTLDQQRIANLQDLWQSIPSFNFATTTATRRERSEPTSDTSSKL